MSKFSVKKPFTVFVAVIAVLVLGVVAYLKMTPDLLPNMDFPYVVITTVYPGATPEKVEQEVTKPLEQSMSTLEHIKEITSTSSENYSMLMLEFEDDVDMEVIGVDIQQNISTLSSGWDEMIGVPYVLKINPSLLPVEVAALSMDGMDTMALTEFLDETLMNKLEGIAGVARINASGLITQQLHVVLDQQKLDAVNKTISDAINKKMDEALEELTKTKQELEEAQEKMEQAKEELESGKDALADQMAEGEAELSYQQAQLLSTKAELQAQLTQLQSGKTQLETTLSVLKAVQAGIAELTGQVDGIAKDLDVLLELKKRAEELEALQAEFEAQLEEIRKNNELPPEEIEAAIKEIQESEAYKAMLAELASLRATLESYGLDMDALDAAIQEKQDALEDLRARIEALGEMLPENEEGFDLDAQIEDMEASIAQIDEGIAAIEDGIEQIDSGMLQLKDAAELLSSKKTEGLLQLSNAANELAVNGATVSAALTQVEGGMETLESTRTDTLAKANLHKILTMDMVSQLLTAQNFAMPAGYVDQEGVSYMVSVGELITDQQAVEDLLLFDVGMEGVAPVYLKDVAMVMLTDNRDQTYAKLNGKDGIVLTFEKQSTYATAEATNNIADRFRELEKEYPGLTFVSLMDQGDYIYLIAESIISSLLLGALFSAVILFVFLKDLRPTFITVCSIPISVIFAIVLMYFSNVTINMISLSGLAVSVGMLVDNSVVVIENIYRLRAKGASAIQAAVSGAAQVAGAIVSSTLTTVCVFLPIVFVEGLTKQLFTDLALTMTYSLLASLIVAMTLVPAMAAGTLRKEKQTSHRLMDKVLSFYQKLLQWSLKHKAVVLIAAVVLLVVTATFTLLRGFIFMPNMDMPNVAVTVAMPENTSVEEAGAYADEVINRINTLDGIATTGAMLGGGLSLGGSATNNNVTIYVILEDDTASGAAVGKQIEALCADMECTVSATSAMLDLNMLTGSGVTLELYANDMQTLQAAAKKAAAALAEVDGIASVSDGLDAAMPALHIQVDRNKAMAKGITVAQIYMELAAALQTNTTAATLELSGTTTDVIIEKAEGSLVNAGSLKDFPFEITNFAGEKVSFVLSDVAEIRETTSLASISRVNQRRYLTVSATVAEGENVTLITAKAQSALRRADLGDGVTYLFTGENEAIMEAMEQLSLMLLLGILLVYLVMVAQFQSLKSPFIVMFTIPLAFTGGFLAILLCGMEMSVISLIGFVMLTGIIVNNGIVLVDYINQLRAEGMSRVEAILEAGKTRMRPILMTSITTILGLGDMALRQNIGTALMRPMAVVCIGGLLYATLMTLFVVPCVYDWMNKKELRVIREDELKILDI